MTASPRPARRRYRALARLLDGYFHQDFVLEHGDAAGAALAFARDAGPRDLEAAARDLAHFIAFADGRLIDEWRPRLSRLGGAWSPSSLAELRAVLAILEGAED